MAICLVILPGISHIPPLSSNYIYLVEDVNIVVVEGGPKQQKKYKQLMMSRIKWEEDTYTDKEGNEHNNQCELIWEVSKFCGTDNTFSMFFFRIS